MAVVEFLEERDRLLVRGGRLQQIASKVIRHAQQVIGFGDPPCILCWLKQGERLLVVVQRDARLFDVHMPIAQAVETPGAQRGVSKSLGKVEGLASLEREISRLCTSLF